MKGNIITIKEQIDKIEQKIRSKLYCKLRPDLCYHIKLINFSIEDEFINKNSYIMCLLTTSMRRSFDDPYIS